MNDRVRALSRSRGERITPLRLGTRRRIARENAIMVADVSRGQPGQAPSTDPLLDLITHQALTLWRAAATALTPMRLAVWAAGPRAHRRPCEARLQGPASPGSPSERRPACV